MNAFRDVRILPVVLMAIFGLAVLKIAGLVIDGGYVFDYQPQVAKKSWAQDTFNFPGGATADSDITGSSGHGAKAAEPAKPAVAAPDVAAPTTVAPVEQMPQVSG